MTFREVLTIEVLAIVVATAMLASSTRLWRVLRRSSRWALNSVRRSRLIVATRELVRGAVARRVIARIEARRDSVPGLAVEAISEYKLKIPPHRLRGEVVPNGVARLSLRVRDEARPGRQVQIEWRKGANNCAPIDRAWSALKYGVPTTVVTGLRPLDDESIGVVVDSWQPGHWSGDPIPDNPPPARFRYWASVEYRIRVLGDLDTVDSRRHPSASVRTALRFLRSVSEYGTPWTGWQPARFAPEAGDDVIVEKRNC